MLYGRRLDEVYPIKRLRHLQEHVARYALPIVTLNLRNRCLLLAGPVPSFSRFGVQPTSLSTGFAQQPLLAHGALYDSLAPRPHFPSADGSELLLQPSSHDAAATATYLDASTQTPDLRQDQVMQTQPWDEVKSDRIEARSGEHDCGRGRGRTCGEKVKEAENR